MHTENKQIAQTTKKHTAMKKFILTLTAVFALTISANAMSYEQARQQALFLTDKMAYELNLTDEQYQAAYEINLDYLLSVNTRNDVFGDYWRWRLADMEYILLDWQFRAFCDALYFYRPLYWDAGYWHFRIYTRYPHRTYLFFGRPHFWNTYRGGHGWRHNGGRSYYHGRDIRPHHRDHRDHHGMKDRFDRGDYRNGFGQGNNNRNGNHGRGDRNNNANYGRGDRNNNGNHGRNDRPDNGNNINNNGNNRTQPNGNTRGGGFGGSRGNNTGNSNVAAPIDRRVNDMPETRGGATRSGNNRTVGNTPESNNRTSTFGGSRNNGGGYTPNTNNSTRSTSASSARPMNNSVSTNSMSRPSTSSSPSTRSSSYNRSSSSDSRSFNRSSSSGSSSRSSFGGSSHSSSRSSGGGFSGGSHRGGGGGGHFGGRR